MEPKHEVCTPRYWCPLEFSAGRRMFRIFAEPARYFTDEHAHLDLTGANSSGPDGAGANSSSQQHVH